MSLTGCFLGIFGAPGEIRTPDPLVRSQVLYPTELRAREPGIMRMPHGAVNLAVALADVGDPLVLHGPLEWPFDTIISSQKRDTLSRATPHGGRR
jgi:hypothetical protein